MAPDPDPLLAGLTRRSGVDVDSPFGSLLLDRLPPPLPDDDLTPDARSQRRAHEAVAQVAAGGIVVVVDDTDREDEGDLIMAADAVTPESVAFFLQHTSGVLCVALTGERCDALRLPLMVSRPTEAMGTAFTVTVDAAAGTTTGISAADRARTVTALADPATTPEDLLRPGHVFPLRARPGGVLERPGHTEAAVDLARLAGREPAGLLSEVVTRDRSEMARRPELRRFAARHGLPVVSVADLAQHRRTRERLVRPRAAARVPTRWGELEGRVFVSALDGTEHLALVLGDVTGPAGERDAPLVRLHSECLTGDVLGSLRCDCGDQLDSAMAAIAAEGRGVLVYLRGHEGRGIGVAAKIAAYGLQDGGLDTVDANLALGLPVDAREFDLAAQVLTELGVTAARLITNNPAKGRALAAAGIAVTRVPAPTPVTDDNAGYLRAKRDRLGHLTPAPSG